MPVILQKWIMRIDLRNNPTVLYLFGDNELRVGLGGQAKEMRGEPNAVGIRTKKSPGMASADFWSDDRLDECKQMLDEDFKPVELHLTNGRIVVIPADGLGTGLSDLPQRAPKVFEYLETKIRDLYQG